MKKYPIKILFVSTVSLLFFLLLIVLFFNEDLEKSSKITQTKTSQENINTFSADMKTDPVGGYQIYYNLASRTTFSRSDLKTFFNEEHVAEIPEERINFEISKVYYNNGYYDLSIKLLEKELRENPCNTEVQNELGNIYVKKNKKDDLYRMASMSIALCKNDIQVYTSLSQIFNRCDDFEQGKKILEAGIVSNPIEYELRYVFADYLISKGFFLEAENELLRALNYNQNDAAGYFNLGELYEKMGKIEKAREYYEIAGQISPDYADMIHDIK
jgi:tetratricopeptide (TPR) repeat protein